MVVKKREDGDGAPRDAVKLGFSRRLNELLADRPETRDERKRRSWLKATFGVSTETARKWLTGLAIPDQTHLAMMVKVLRVDGAWLHAGVTAAAEGPDDHYYKKLTAIWKDLSDDTKGQLLGFAMVSAAMMPGDEPKKSTLPRTGN